jgi:major inositol transporter-like SP family MFS transporter
MRRLLWIGIGLAVAQQFTGVNTIIYYGTTILESTGLGASASIVATVTLGTISVIGVITGIILLGYFNRRPLLMFGFASVAISHIVLALSFQLPESTFRSYLILAAMLVFMFCMQTFAGPIVWLVLSEIFPMTIRGFAWASRSPACGRRTRLSRSCSRSSPRAWGRPQCSSASR